MVNSVKVGFNAKIMILDDLLKKHRINTSSREALDKFLKTGNCTPAMQDFLSKELYDCKILSRMEVKISGILDEV